MVTEKGDVGWKHVESDGDEYMMSKVHAHESYCVIRRAVPNWIEDRIR